MHLFLDSVNWFNGMLRPLMAGLDVVVFTLLGWIVEGIFNLSKITANPDFINIIYRRIYIILSIFMVFKLTFSFIQYLVNPDAMNDKERGVGKLIARTITMICILILLPILFFNTEILDTDSGDRGTVLDTLQMGALETIPKLIFGVSGGGTVASNSRDYGEEMALMMLRSFYYPMDCRNANPNQANNNCDIVTGNNIATLVDFEASVLEPNVSNSSEYKFYYQWPLTTISGIVLVVIMLGISIDVAIRCFKLMILQMIAPIPIMTYIDPKSSKDGAFGAWLKMYITTYVDIFVKLASVYLVLLLLSQLFSSSGLFDNMPQGFMAKNYVFVFLVIGLFKFAKDAPKFIKDAMGIKDNGGGGGFMGKALAGMAGAAAGFAGGLATGGLSGGLSGLTTGYSAGLAGKAGQAFSQVRDEQAKLLGKTPGGIRGKLQNKAMQHSVMKHTGLNKDSLAAAKQDMIKKQNIAAKLEADYAYGRETDYGKVIAANKAAAKAQSNYNDANSLAGQIGLKPNFFEENKRHGAIYRAANRVLSKPLKTDNIANTWLDHNERKYKSATYTDAAGKKFTGYDAVEESQSAAKAAKSAYDSAKAGGFGPISGSDRAADISAARSNYKTARDEAKQVKKDGKI